MLFDLSIVAIVIIYVLYTGAQISLLDIARWLASTGEKADAHVWPRMKVYW